MKKTALVAGSTGLVGKELLKLLLDDPDYAKVITLVRRNTHIQHKKLEEHIIDFEDLEKYHNIIKADRIFCCLGTTMKKAGSKDNFYKVDFTYPYQLAGMALENKCPQFNLISSIGADRKSFFFYSQVKGKLELEISNLGFDSLNIFRPSLLLGERSEKRKGELFGKAMMQILQPFFILGLKKYRPVQAKTVADVMVKAAEKIKHGLTIYESDRISKMKE